MATTLLAAVWSVAQAQPKKTVPPEAPATTAQSPAALAAADTSAPALEVTGFRSAKFGMDEAQVRDAIGKDFALKGAAVKSTTNAAERTHGLVVRVPDVLPEGGAADVSYAFGYKSQKLIQVSIVWSKTTDPGLNAEKLVANADVLRADFMSKGYKPETLVVDTPVRNGLLMFRGADAAGHTTALLLEGRTVANKDQKVFTPVSLLLIYIANPNAPDVFRLGPDQF